MVSVRDIEKVLSLLRRLYESSSSTCRRPSTTSHLALLDAADTILEIVTYDSTTIHNTLAMAETFRAIGYPADKVRYLVNRADSTGGIAADDLARALGRRPGAHASSPTAGSSCQANNEGVPFVLAEPGRRRSASDVARSPGVLLAPTRPPPPGGG